MEIVELDVGDAAAAEPWYAELPADREPPSTYWATEEYAAVARGWCESVLGPSLELTMEQVKLRAWSTVWKATAAGESFYFKENCELQSFEAALAVELAALVPHHVVPVTAADLDRGLLLTPDHGPVFGATVADDLDAWCRVAAEGAALQRDLLGSVDRLVAAGLTPFTAADAPAYVEARTEQYATLPTTDPRHLPAENATAVRDHLPVVRRWAEQVAALGMPLTLNHNDLHENNVFDIDGELRFFDFGDALLTEPLAQLVIPISAVRNRLECPADDPRLARVADAALEVWSDLVPAADLRAALPAALQLGRLGRLESWVRVGAAMTETELLEWGSLAPAWLMTLLEDSPYSPERAGAVTD